jgi:hypothetical protein
MVITVGGVHSPKPLERAGTNAMCDSNRASAGRSAPIR